MAMVHLPGASSSINHVKAANTFSRRKLSKFQPVSLTKNVQEIVMRLTCIYVLASFSLIDPCDYAVVEMVLMFIHVFTWIASP